jgi:hypothetical protein
MVAGMNMNTKNMRIGAGILLLVALAGVVVFVVTRPVSAPSSEEPLVREEPTETTEPAPPSTGGTAPSAFPRVLATMPKGATAIDDHAFTDQNGVQFLSITGTSTLAIPGADTATFKRLTDFMTSPDPAIKSSCGVAGEYAFYSDKNRVYFYQLWFAPKFRTSRVEVIADAKPETFKVVDSTNFLDAKRALYLDYDVAVATTTTCSYAIRAK